MKRWLCTVLAVIIACSAFSACGRKPTEYASRSRAAQDPGAARASATFPPDKKVFDMGEPDESGFAEASVYCWPSGWNDPKNLGSYKLQLKLPSNWTVKRGLGEGSGYYPDEALFRGSVSDMFKNEDRSFVLLDENGEIKGRIFFGSPLTEKNVKQHRSAESIEATEENLKLSLKDLFCEDSGFVSEAPGAVTVAADETRLVIIGFMHAVRSNDVKNADGGAESVDLPAIAAYVKEAGIGVIVELAEGAFTEAELRAAAESVNVIAPR